MFTCGVYFTICLDHIIVLQVLVTQLLRMRYLSLDGLRMTEATVCVLSMLAAVPFSPLNVNTALSGTQCLLYELRCVIEFVMDLIY